MEELQATMSNTEFVHWGMYFARKAQRTELAHRMAQHEKR